MNSSFKIKPKIVIKGIIAAAFLLAMHVSVLPVMAADNCRDMAVTIGGCSGATDESCILEYCAGKAFEDIGFETSWYDWIKTESCCRNRHTYSSSRV